jgi:hypothetical protein
MQPDDRLLDIDRVETETLRYVVQISALADAAP